MPYNTFWIIIMLIASVKATIATVQLNITFLYLHILCYTY